jgi:hypothetical protein
MKTLLLSILLWTVVTGCKKSEIGSSMNGQPGEVAAVITKIDLSSLADCACCASYQIQIGSDTFQADQLPVSFETLTANVWIKYDRRQLSGVCSQVHNRIGITSIRNR